MAARLESMPPCVLHAALLMFSSIPTAFTSVRLTGYMANPFKPDRLRRPTAHALSACPLAAAARRGGGGRRRCQASPACHPPLGPHPCTANGETAMPNGAEQHPVG